MRKSFFHQLRSRWVGLPGAMLMVLLQRTPAISLTVATEQLALRAPIGAMLKSAIAGLAALGTVNTMVGATPLVPNVGSADGITVTTGTPVNVFFTVTGTQTPPMSWTVAGSFPPGLNFSGRTSGGTISVGTLNMAGTPTTAGVFHLTITAFEFTAAGGTPSPQYDYTVTVNQGGPVLVAPTFSQHPASQTVTAGSTVTFNSAASGTPDPTFQWRKGGNNIGGANGASFSIANVSAGDAGDYTVVATNSEGSVTSNVATLVVNAALAAPSFSQHPAGQTVTEGQSVTFNAAASGNPAPGYQWRKNGFDIGGANGSSFTIPSPGLGDAGDYTVVASNSQGSVTSNTATLVVNPNVFPPGFSLQPAGLSAAVGSSVTLMATATGSPAPTYQWRRNGSDIGGATASSYGIGSVGFGDAGDYSVVATNSQGSATSNIATLVVTKVVPVITWNPSLLLSEGTALDDTRLNAMASTPGVIVYDFPLGTTFTAGTHVVTATFTPTDTTNFSNASLSLTFTVLPPRPATFDANGYLANNPDVAATIGDVPDKLDKAWAHYYQFGLAEGRTDGDFNVQAYLGQYPNVAAQFGTDLKAAAVYWYTTGRQQGDRIPNGFSVAGYFARNADIAALFINDHYGAWLHYYNYGLFEGRSFDANFIPAEYLELNTDLKGAFGSNWQEAVMHWLTWGHPVEDRMGRVPIGFNVDSYLARYPDLSAAFGGITPTAVRNVTVWNHYVNYGVLEGRSDGDFEAYNYLATNADLALVFGSDVRAAAHHWYFYGRREGRRIPSNFDVQNYRALYPDIVVVYGDDLYGSWLHFRDVGVYEGRIYDNLFRPDEYLALNPDVAAVIGNDRKQALLHWLFYGKDEGRPGRF